MRRQEVEAQSINNSAEVCLAIKMRREIMILEEYRDKGLVFVSFFFFKYRTTDSNKEHL
jgi:hypothetical protein